MANKKGSSLSINTIIYLILGLLVLVLVILIFSGEIGNVFNSVKDIFNGTVNNKPDIGGLIK